MSDPKPDPVASTDAPEETALTAAMTKTEGIVVCDACPVLCRIRAGRTGACDRYGNVGGALARLDPLLIMRRVAERQGRTVPFLAGGAEDSFVTGIGAGTTYPDYKPAPFIVASRPRGVDMVTVVTEGIFSYCGLKLKIDTDRYIGPEQAAVRAAGEQVGHVTTAEYGSQMLALGGVRHLTGGSKKEGNVACQTMLTLCNKGAAELAIDGGATLTVQAGRAPVIDGVEEARMRVGCGSATIGIFARQWHGHVDEVIVVDDHITGVLTE
ncbi:MAG: 6-hydroxynicotinate reductase, partial [Dongiaceae bacterium]